MTVTQDGLEKALTSLADMAQGGPLERKNTLMQKSMHEGLTESENDELRNLLSGRVEKSASDRIEQHLAPEHNESISKALDVSDFLSSQHHGIVKSLTEIAEVGEAAGAEQREFNLMLAKSLIGLSEKIDDLLGKQDDLEKSFGEVVGQPARAPKTQAPGAAQPVARQIANSGGENKLTKSQVLDVMEHMMKSSLEGGANGQAKCGEPLDVAISKYEQTARISKALHDEVLDHIKQNGGSAALLH